MFKIVVFSDSHGSSDEMEKVIKIEAPDLVIFLGDGEKDIDQIQSIYDDSKVKGKSTKPMLFCLAIHMNRSMKKKTE